jgi:hypothetical protein
VAEDSDCTVISRRDAEDAVVMSHDHYNGLMETLHLLQSPANTAQLRRSIDQYRAGPAGLSLLAEAGSENLAPDGSRQAPGVCR